MLLATMLRCLSENDWSKETSLNIEMINQVTETRATSAGLQRESPSVSVSLPFPIQPVMAKPATIQGTPEVAN